MMKAGIDQDALVKLFAESTARQADTLRKAVSDATLKALQGRELTAENIRKVLKSVTQASTLGAQQNTAPSANVESMLTQAFGGMDAALLQAVEAQRKALGAMVDQGVALQDKQMVSALAGVEKLEDVFFDAVGKAAHGAGGALEGPWRHVLDAMRAKGTDTGTQAASAVEQLVAQARTALRDNRASSMRATRTMLDSYAALASGVLLGMSQALTAGGTQPTAEGGAPSGDPAASARRRKAATG